MVIFKKVADISAHLHQLKNKGVSTGFVPTMGALHAGHISLIKQAKETTEVVICSIFVNPTQFNNLKDYEKYPVTITEDVYLLEKANCDILFLPGVEEMYPGGVKKVITFDLGILETILDGKYRPGHFQGVCQVMERLLEITMPDKLFMGQKDYQQCLVLKQLTKVKFSSVDLIICQTLREADGLAMSSRNLRLSEDERQSALKIFEALILVKDTIEPGDLSHYKINAVNFLTQCGFKVDYVEIAEDKNLQLLQTWDGKQIIVVLIAAFLNEVRLIDNLIINS